MKRILQSIVVMVAAGCGVTACVAERDCSLVACTQGVLVAFRTTEPGLYRLDVTVDARSTVCYVSRPADAALSVKPTCADDTMLIETVKTEYVDGGGVNVGELHIFSTRARRVSIAMSRDSESVAAVDFEPSYEVVSRDINGPGCDPPTCVVARQRLN